MCFPSLTVCSTLPFQCKTPSTQTCKFTCGYLIFLEQDNSPANAHTLVDRWSLSIWVFPDRQREQTQASTSHRYSTVWILFPQRAGSATPVEYESPTTEVGTTMHFPVFSRTPNWPSLTVSDPQCWTSCLLNEFQSVSNGCAFLSTLVMTTDCWKHG